MNNNDISQVYSSLGWNIANRDFREASEFKSLPEFNQYLVNNSIVVDLESYIETTNKGHFKCDLSFMKDFMGMVKEKGFVVRHSRLQTTGVVSNDVSSSRIKDCLESNFLIEGIDYLVEPELHQHQSGLKHKNTYMLTPRAFKKCLIRSKNTQVYANYYLTLEEAVVYFMEYQTELRGKCMLILKSRGDSFEEVANRLEINLAEHEENIKQFKEKIELDKERHEENIKQFKEKIELDKERQEIDKQEMDRKLNFLMAKAEEDEKKKEKAEKKIRQIAPDRVLQPAAPENGECLVIIKLKEKEFKVTRCKVKQRNLNVKKILKENADSEVWMDIKHPNAKSLFILMSQKISCITVQKQKALITLKNVGTEDELRLAIQVLEQERLD